MLLGSLMCEIHNLTCELLGRIAKITMPDHLQVGLTLNPLLHSFQGVCWPPQIQSLWDSNALPVCPDCAGPALD